MMIFKNIGYFLSEALTSMYRNRLLSIATISTMAISVLFLGVAVLMTLNASSLMNRLESDIEIVAYLDDSLTRVQINDLKKELEALEGVEAVAFVSKDEALQRLNQRFTTENYEISKTLGKNPLPNSYEVRARDPQKVAGLAEQIKTMAGVYKVNYGQEVVEKLFLVTKWVRIISVGLMVILAIGSIFLIATTIRLAIFARRKEVYLMKLIGATDWFVRWPFFIEGITLGLAGAAVAVAILALAYNSILVNLQTAFFFVPLVRQPSTLLNIYLSLLGTGGLLGILGTYVSVNRFLDI